MSRYALDTNLYIDAIRDARAAAALANFLGRFSPHTYLSAVVVQELLAGAVTVTIAEEVEAEMIRPYERVGRIVTPSYRSFRQTGEVLAALVRKGAVLAKTERGFVNDVLLAASCLERGLTLVTRNARDFARIAAQLPGFRFVAPYPSR